MSEPEYDPQMEFLLNLNGESYCIDPDCGYWVKFEISRVDPDEHIPHGIKYSLTLHDKYNYRIMGYDNAHAIKKPKRKKYSAKKTTYDHKHIEKHVYDYEYSSPGELIEDFWKDVGRFMESGDIE